MMTFATSLPALDADAPPPPTRADVVVVGGGVNGLMTAYWLAGRGVNVVVCEKGTIGAEASRRAFGWVSQLLLDSVKMPLGQESQRLWVEIQDEVGETGYRRNGLIYVADTDDEVSFYDAWLRSVAGQADRDIRVLTADETLARLPGASRRWAGAIWAPNDGSVEPPLVSPRVADAATKRGATILQNVAVHGLDVSGGRIQGVWTERGRIAASTVVCAANYWSRRFLAPYGIDVPQLNIIMSMGRTHSIEDGPPGCGGQEHWAWRKRIDGGYSLGRLRGQRLPLTPDSLQLFSRFIPAATAEGRNVRLGLDRDAWREWTLPRRWPAEGPSPFARCRTLQPRVDPHVPLTSLRLNAKAFSAFQGAELAETWAGTIGTTPDNLPIASPLDALSGLYLLTGCAYGLTWAPALGKLLADLIVGRAPSIDAAPFRFSRFSDGSPLQFAH